MSAGAEEEGSDTETDLGQLLIPSGVHRTAGPVLPSEAEATGILDRANLDLTPPLEVIAPRFEIPAWVDTTDPAVGDGVAGYRILGRIGAGAMGTVYLCDHREREGPVALKILAPEASAEAKARFKREILANGFFSHPGVIDVYDAGHTTQGHYYLAMEFFDGADLEAVLETTPTLSLRQSLLIARQVLEALGAAHAAGIVHRDVKPANILISHDGRTAKLMDFGIALIKDLGDFKAKVFESDAGGVTGTPEYLSPEQAFRDPVGPPADLYSVGLVLYRMLSGRLPFSSGTAHGWINCHIAEEPLPLAEATPREDLPRALGELIAQLLIKDPCERLATAAEVVARIDAIQRSLGGERKSSFFRRFRRGF
ncbi:MAG: serine/threonine protein kinase [Planctomycetota bacterium]|nr:MAG: serine/threonine protein kinase [Planctomycetota bacterium]